LFIFLCFFSLSASAQAPKESTPQKWTYILLVVKERPTGKVTESETFETLEDLKHFVANNAKAAPDCPCGEDCACVDCKCEKIEKADPKFGAVSEGIRVLLGMSRKQYIEYLKTEEGQDTLLYPRDREYQLEILRSRKAKKDKESKAKLTAVDLYIKHQNEIGGGPTYRVQCEKE